MKVFRLLVFACIFMFFGFDSYAREPVNFTHSSTLESFYFSSSTGLVTDYVQVKTILTYDDLVNYLGVTSVGDTLTFTINSVTGISYKVIASNNCSLSVANANPVSSFAVSATPAGGGSAAATPIKPGEEVTISYGGGDLVFYTYPVYLRADLTSYGYYRVNISSTWSFSFASAPLSDNEALNELVDNQNKFRQEDRDNATQAGNDASSLVTDMQDLENKWAILWLPIKFTQQVISVFTGGTSSQTYIAKYYNVTGYSYDEETGFLVPVRNPVATIADARASAGAASITFPAYTLPVINEQIWDSYTFDLQSIKDSFPALFDLLYVAITVLEVYWFIGFLREKYDEVFGG